MQKKVLSMILWVAVLVSTWLVVGCTALTPMLVATHTPISATPFPTQSSNVYLQARELMAERATSPQFKLPAAPKCGAGSVVEFVDLNTQRKGMHSCPLGMFVTGVHVAENKLLCASGYGSYSEIDEIVDVRTQSLVEYPAVKGFVSSGTLPIPINMHTCPKGRAVTGIHVANNLLACAPFEEACVGFGKYPWIPKLDPEGGRILTEREGMHACPHKRPLLGIHVGSNVLLCIGPDVK